MSSGERAISSLTRRPVAESQWRRRGRRGLRHQLDRLRGGGVEAVGRGRGGHLDVPLEIIRVAVSAERHPRRDSLRLRRVSLELVGRASICANLFKNFTAKHREGKKSLIKVLGLKVTGANKRVME